jgi:nicotinamide-nucleotide amidase
MAPTAHLLITGDEILLGDSPDTNGPHLARELETLGFAIEAITIVGDDRPLLVRLLRELSGRVELVLMTGGLGPTEDDHTREAFAEAFDRPLEEDPGVLEVLLRHLARRNIPLRPGHRRQARFPRGSLRLLNSLGTAPGFALEERGTWFYTMPGVPRELEVLWTEQIRPHVAARHRLPPPLRCAFWTFGQPESVMAAQLEGFKEAYPELDIGYRATLKGLQVKAKPHAGVEVTPERFATAKADLQQVLGSILLAEGVTSLEQEVAVLLRARGQTLAVAESFTGGLVAHQLTDVPGSSTYFRLGLVAYTEELKVDLLGVPAELIAEKTVYSEEVAAEMAQRVRTLAGTDLGLGTTGVAGPDGGTAERPVGWVALGLALPDGSTRTRQAVLPGPRDYIKALGANGALYLLYRYLKEQTTS